MPDLMTRLRRYERWWPLAFFLLGFLYDVVTLDRIDSLFGIVKQGVYLIVIAIMLGLECLLFGGKFKPSGKLASVWKYHELVVHFFLGSLLSEYTLFFFVSASIFTSFVFLGLLALILVLNEFKQFQGDRGIPVRATLFSLCLISYFIYLVPVVLGFVGALPFLSSLAISSVVFYFLIRALLKMLPEQRRFIIKRLFAPFMVVVATFAGLYFTHLIPPVPLAVKYMGIFHEVKKEQGQYVLGYTRPWWKFWQSGDQAFLARPGDKLFCFVRIFSPSRFQDQVQIRWLKHEGKRGWQRQDAIPLPITGGREQGYRGFTFKSNYQPGSWQVRVETRDEREVGRIYFTIEEDSSQEPREFRYDRH